MNIQDIIMSDEPPSQEEIAYCIGIGYFNGYNNPVIIREVNENYSLNTTKKDVKEKGLFYMMFAAGACWLFDRNTPKLSEYETKKQYKN